MNRRALWVSSVIVSLLLITAACASKTAPTAKATSPSPTVTSTAKPTASPTSAPPPTAKPTTSAPAVSFAGKTVTIIVPTTAGGSADIAARLDAIYLRKYLPGQPNVVIRDMPGGNQTMGSNYAYSSKPDGLTALLSPSTVLMNYIMGLSAVRYDLRKMEPIIGTAEGAVYYARPGIVSKVEDLPKTKDIIYGGSSGSVHLIYLTAIDVLGLSPEKVVLAFAFAESTRALLSKEISMTGSSISAYWSGIHQYVQKGEIQVLFQAGILDEKGSLVRAPNLPSNIPTGKEVHETVNRQAPSGVAWDAYQTLVASRAYESILWLPPSVPDNILGAYREAAEKTLKDPEFRVAAASVAGEGTPWYAGKAFSDSLKAGLTMDPKVLTWLKGMLQKYGVVVE